MQDGWCRGVPRYQETLVLNGEVHFHVTKPSELAPGGITLRAELMSDFIVLQHDTMV